MQRARAGGPNGYILSASDGGVFNYGNIPFCGSTGSIHLNRPVVAAALTQDGGGYWEVASDGGIFAFGDAGFFGSMGGKPLNAPIVGMAATPDGGGYWEVASDGGIFSFGDAGFYGSAGSIHLNRPIVGMAATPRRQGLLAGRRPTAASSPTATPRSTAPWAASRSTSRSSGMAADAQTGGYWEVASDGGIFSFGAPFYGSTGQHPPQRADRRHGGQPERLGLPLRRLRRRHLLLQRPVLRLDGRQAAEQAGGRHGGDLSARSVSTPGATGRQAWSGSSSHRANS